MRVSMASAARGGRANEDFVGGIPNLVVLVDGAGIPGGEATCRHGVAWYAARLGDALLALAAGAQSRSLRSLLADGIEQVTDEHRDSCDVTNPVSPSAAVAIVRVAAGVVDHLVLGDAVVVLNRRLGAPLVVQDRREVVISASYRSAFEDALTSEERDRVLRELRAHRNQPGGFWVAKDDPRAADEAVTGSCPVSELSEVVLLSNGASAIVDRFALTDWAGLLAVLSSRGPAEVLRLRRVRETEAGDGVTPDDATIAYCTDLGVV
jgi:hypothetical protein